MGAKLYSYVVRYDSGFAPNPFYGFCTLATCKPLVRKSAQVGDWIVGTGRADKKTNRGDHIVHAMQVTETMDFRCYDADPRFLRKKPMRQGGRKQSCGDNIYFRDADNNRWLQRDSFHTNPDGSLKPEHVTRDTGVDRVLISDKYYYFGGLGPKFPAQFRDFAGYDICRKVRQRKRVEDADLIAELEGWLKSLGEMGYVGMPMDWVLERA
jgi:hypothetical protein